MQKEIMRKPLPHGGVEIITAFYTNTGNLTHVLLQHRDSFTNKWKKQFIKKKKLIGLFEKYNIKPETVAVWATGNEKEVRRKLKYAESKPNMHGKKQRHGTSRVGGVTSDLMTLVNWID